MFKRIAFPILFALAICLAGFHLQHFVLAHAQAGEPVLHKRVSFDLSISQPYDRVAPLFGANGERAWGGADWDPHFVFPNPAQDQQGDVFTVKHGGHEAVWMTPIFDLAGRHIQHWYVIPDVMVTQIDITFSERSPNSTKVHVVYDRTALSPAMNDHVARFSAHDAGASAEWQQAIDDYFAGRKKP